MSLLKYIFVCSEYGEKMDHLTSERLNALTEAAASGRTKDIIPLLENITLINGKDEDGCTPLYRACANGRSETALELLRRGADSNITCHDGSKTCLGIAIEQSHPAIVEMLLTPFFKRVGTFVQNVARKLFLQTKSFISF